MTPPRRAGLQQLKFAPLVGAGIGAASGLACWLALQLWPASIAVAVGLLAGALLSPVRLGVSAQIFYNLLKYTALMSISAARLPVATPSGLTIPLVFICAYGASRALHAAVARISHRDLAIALLLGFAPSALLGIPGLVGLAVAVIVAIAFTRIDGAALARRSQLPLACTEVSFYLAASAAWSLV